MLKLAWLAATGKSLWATWFRAKYCRDSSIWHPSNPKSGSTIWKQLRALSPYLQRESKWVVGNDKLINIWFDNQIDKEASNFPSFQFLERDLLVDIISKNAWQIPSQLPSALKDLLHHSTNSIFISEVPDYIFWPSNSSGSLLLSDAWNLLRSRDFAKSWPVLIWDKFVNPHLACFSWRLMHRKTPTEIWNKHRGWSLAPRCHNCLGEEENDLHLFFICPQAQQFWHWMLGLCGVPISTGVKIDTGI